MTFPVAGKVSRRLISGPLHLLPQAPQGGDLAGVEFCPVKHPPKQVLGAAGAQFVGVANVVEDLKQVGVHRLVLLAGSSFPSRSRPGLGP